MSSAILMPPLEDNRQSSPELDDALQQVLWRVRLRAQRRAAWLRHLWSHEGEPGGASVVTHAEIDTHLGDRDAPAAEAQWLDTHAPLAESNAALADLEKAINGSKDSPLIQLKQIFHLSDIELDIVQACVATAIDPSLARVYAYLQDHAGRAYVSDELVARLFGHGRGGVCTADSPLWRWGIVEEREVAPHEPPRLVCDRVICDWLQGRRHLDPALLAVAQIHEPKEPLHDWPVEATADFIDGIVRDDPFGRVRVQVTGLPGSGRRTLAAAVASRLGLPLLAIDTDLIAEFDWPSVFLRAQRQAFLERAAVAWSGESLSHRRWPRTPPSFPIQFVILDAGQPPPAPVEGFVEHSIELAAPSLDERRRLWSRYVPQSSGWEQTDLAELARRYRVTAGEIAIAARKGPGSARAAAEAVREQARGRLGKLAQRVECSFRRDDLVVSNHLRDALEDLVYEAENRAAFWERPEARRLFPQGRGLLALFSGPPGTGKTMAAQVIAATLGLDLFRIDLSAVVSKYVGETSQNLERILARAQHMDVVLLFDEFDALGGKRTEIRDAHDRFANTDTNYLLQAIEDYQGVALLSTNKKSNIDPAFIRRIRYVLEFPKPDADQRLEIWRRLVSELAGADRLHSSGENGRSLDVQLRTIAKTIETSGAQIKYAVLASILAAQRDGEPLGVRHVLHGLDRELAKEGRSLSARDKERVQAHGS